MCTVVLLSALSLVQLHSSYNSRKAAYDTLMSAQALLGAVTDTQRGMRGYVLTGQPEALEAYHRGLEAAPKTLAELTALTRDNAAQQQLASPLVGDLGRMIDYSHRLLAARDSFGLQAAVELESTGEGRAVLNRFRADLQQLNDTIHRLLLDRDARTEENFRNTTFLLILAMVVAVILLARAQIAAIRAIALRRRTEASLAEEQERLKITLSSIGDAVITTDADTCITYINATGETLLGQTLKDLKSRRLDEVMTLTQPNTSKAAPNLLGQSILHVKAFRRETACVLHRPDGVACYVRDLVSPVLDSQGFITGVVVVLQDAGADVERAQDLNHRASHDVLTGLANRSEFHRRLKVVFDRATQLDLPAALLAIDLDRFKAVNDTGGHAAGDAVLRRVAEVLRGTVRHSDIVARLGGDEFAVIFPNCPPARSSILAQKILQALNPLETDWEESSYSVGASIGLAVISAHFKEPAEWLAAADRACYQAKNEGRGQLSSAQSMPAED
jgi:diguanylate cyclase (GGDEF)-like protein/PAS domain S-box-containing protein